MFQILLGCIVLLATAFGFWFARPVGGKVQPWITPRFEPYVAVALVLGAGTGLVLIFAGSISLPR